MLLMNYQLEIFNAKNIKSNQFLLMSNAQKKYIYLELKHRSDGC